MDFSPFFSPFYSFGERQLKNAIAQLASLEEKEWGLISDALSQIEAPINRRKIEGAGKQIHEKLNKLSGDDAEGIVGLILQFVGTPNFIAFLEDMEVTDDESRPGVKKAIEFFKANPHLRKVMAADKLIDRGPRLRHIGWFCDIRTQFSASDETQAAKGHPYAPKEEFSLPLVTFRMSIDEVNSPFYFQMTLSELEDHISTLQKACDQLRCLENRERK